MSKNIKLPVVREKIRLIKDSGLKVFGFFIIGYHDETVEDIKKTIDFACKNDFDSVFFTCFHPLAGTPIYEKLLHKGEIERLPEVGDYYEITYAPRGLTIRQLKFLRFWGMMRFYTSNLRRFKTVISYHSLRRKLIFLVKILR
jgi:radical SAM superfamily enzyme YgiQ (UPF0313 family)